MYKSQRVKVSLPILIRISPREIPGKRPPYRNMKEQCLQEGKLRNLFAELPEVGTVEEPLEEENHEEAFPKVLRRRQRESTIPKLKNKKSPQKFQRMKSVKLWLLQIRRLKA